MRILVSAVWLGGAGGAERALYSVLHALQADSVDVVVRKRLDGPYAAIPGNVRVFTLYNWRWRWAAMQTGIKGTTVQRLLNPLRKALLPRYDVYLQFFAGADLNATVRAGLRLLIPSGNDVPDSIASRFDAVALQAPDNVRFVEQGTQTVLLPPPVLELAARADPPSVPLPDQFLLTVFNPYGAVKGTDDLSRIADSSRMPIVWCHSQATVGFTLADSLLNHGSIVHVEDASPENLRFLYERCSGYLCLSLTEGFGWSIADALRYSPAIWSRRIGVLTFPEALDNRDVHVSPELDFDLSVGAGEPKLPRSLDWLSVGRFRERLATLVEDGRGVVHRPPFSSS